MTELTDEEIAREIGDRLLERGMHIFPRSQFEEIVLAALRSARLAARLAERERCAKVAEAYADAQIKGIILGSETAAHLPHDGDEKAPMIADNSAAARLANELAKMKCHLIAAAIRETDSDV